MTDFSHLDALQSRLAREISRRDSAKNENERSFRVREIAACEKEIAAEYKFLGIAPLSYGIGAISRTSTNSETSNLPADIRILLKG